MRHAIITGGAGFIGSHLVDALLAEGGWRVTAVDNFMPPETRAAKERNIAAHRNNPAFSLIKGDIMDDALLGQVFEQAPGGSSVVFHLAALVGVRPSIADPMGYHRTNVTGTLKVLEQARQCGAAHFIQASSSSVYGNFPQSPWQETEPDLRPISPYAASKLAAEHFVRTYAMLHGMDATVLRFFTVYGPRQREDLAIHAFFNKVRSGLPLRRFGKGDTKRDYTYIGDIIAGVRAAADRPMERPPGQGSFEVFNLGNSATVALGDLIRAVEEELGRKAVVEELPEQPGDVRMTHADIGKARRILGYAPRTSLRDGLRHFHDWYRTQEHPAVGDLAGHPPH